jgi:uncharacterized protein YbjT (DUF2867 family)
MKRILVTGGNIGNYVATNLAEKGFLVRVLVQKVTKNTAWDRLGIQQIAGDFNDPGSLRPALEGVEKFFSLSPLAENLAQLGINSIEAAKRSGVRYLVRSSAMGADENAITIGRWHREVEKALESSGLAYTILQPNAFMQNFLLSAGSIKGGSAFYRRWGTPRSATLTFATSPPLPSRSSANRDIKARSTSSQVRKPFPTPISLQSSAWL